MLAAGGNAVDAAIAASAVLAVTTQHMCGMGGDLFALVHVAEGDPACLNASGWAGSGANPERLRAAGHSRMPFRGDVASSPVPGCVDGWTVLAERFATLPLGTLLEPAIGYAADGFIVSDHLAGAARRVADVAGADGYQDLEAGSVLRRPDVARMLRAVADGGREAYYLGEFGDALIELGQGEYERQDLEHVHAEWVTPLSIDVWGHRLWTIPPNSQGYLTLAAAGIAEGLDLPDIADDLWTHYLIEAARHAGYDRLDSLYDGADGWALIDAARLDARRANIRPDAVANLGDTYGGGGTIHLTATDADGGGVSLIQSNASGFGVHLVVPGTGIFLHNRGNGFSLQGGHPAEYRPRRRPPHTLSPALITHVDGRLRTVLGSMGGDAQPQIVLQLVARLLHNRETPAQILAASRWILEPPSSNGFDTWYEPDRPNVILEPTAPRAWISGLERRGHRVEHRPVNVGHAHMIDLVDGVAHAATEPRISTSAAVAPSSD